MRYRRKLPSYASGGSQQNDWLYSVIPCTGVLNIAFSQVQNNNHTQIPLCRVLRRYSKWLIWNELIALFPHLIIEQTNIHRITIVFKDLCLHKRLLETVRYCCQHCAITLTVSLGLGERQFVWPNLVAITVVMPVTTHGACCVVWWDYG